MSIAALDGIEQDADQLARTLKFNDGRHDDLLAHDPTYRAFVARAMDEEVAT